MPERRFDDGYWDDPFVQSLSKGGKLLYAYLFTNKHCNPAGLYQITARTIVFETKLVEMDIPKLFEELAPKVVWYREENLIWVKNFIKRQSISSKFLVAVARCLNSINNNGAIKALLDYNWQRYTLSIPYEYPSDRVSIPSIPPSPSSSSKGERVVKGKGDEDEDAIIKCLGKLSNWQPSDDDLHWLRDFTQEFPDFDLSQLRAARDYYSGTGLPKHKGGWKNRLRNWMLRKQEFERKEKRPRGKSFEQYMAEQEEGT